jgi:hypothetical protein
MNSIDSLAIMAIKVLQHQISSNGYTPRVHFELEGGYRRTHPSREINYQAINHALKQHNILGSLKREFWQNQWEYVSDFVGQSPLKEASDFAAASLLLPRLLKRFGAAEVFIRPILWQGDQGRLQSGCDNIFSTDTRPVHIPNAVQINISADKDGSNVIPHDGFGERLQQRLLDTSFECCLLYLPESEGFERLKLKDDFDLDAELSSPHELSGGHQGSIALYKDVGKHNQPMGLTALVLDDKHQPIATTQDWHSLSRIEHRLGASSERYNPYVNVAFALCNLAQTIEDVQTKQDTPTAPERQLPTQLFSCQQKTGAFEIFESGCWFNQSINQSVALVKTNSQTFDQIPDNLGDLLKQQIIDSYRRNLWVES